MQTLPMLLVRTRTPGILRINGHLAGAAEDTLVLPVSPTGEALVQLFPYGPYLPAAARVQFHRGMALAGQDQLLPHTLTVWPNGVAELTLSALRAPHSRCVDQLKGDACAWYVYQGGGVTLTAEDENERECFSRHFPDAVAGSLRRMQWTPALSAALITHPDGQRLLLLDDSQLPPRVVLDAFGQQLRVSAQGESVQVQQDFFDGAFTRTQTYQRAAQGYQLTQETAQMTAEMRDFAQQEHADWSDAAYDCALTLVRAVMLDCQAQARALYDGDYGALCAALGDFETAVASVLCPMTDSDATVAVLETTAPGVRCARVFGFDVENGRVTRFRAYADQ